MKGKWLYLIGAFIILGMVALSGCGKKESPLQASSETATILSVLSTSGYTKGDAFGGTNDGTHPRWALPGVIAAGPARDGTRFLR